MIWLIMMKSMKELFLKGNDREIPTLYRDMVFAESSRPILFTCRDDKEDRYICSCHCADGEKCEWIVAPTTCERLIDLLSDKITIRQVFDECENPAFLVTRYADRETPEVRAVAVNELSPSILPTAGYYMEAEEGEFNEEIAELEEASKTVTLTGTEQYGFSVCSINIKGLCITVPPVKSLDKEYRMTRLMRRKIPVGA